MAKQSNPSGTIAGWVVARLGGARRVAPVVSVQPSTVYRHTYVPSKPGAIGGGLIPAAWQAPLLAYAEAEGIDLKPEDFVRLRPEPDPTAPAEAADDQSEAA